MILRTPPPKRQRDEAAEPIVESPPGRSDRRLVIYEDPLSAGAATQTHYGRMLCTYQCLQMVKSDFLDSLSSAEKQVHDYQSKLESLSKNFGKAAWIAQSNTILIEAERKKFGDQLLHTEQELATAKGREQALQDQLLKELNDSQERLKKQLQSFSVLEVKIFVRKMHSIPAFTANLTVESFNRRTLS